nr:MAG TPA: hypothetical protein [Caudoviricetes sp.]
MGNNIEGANNMLLVKRKRRNKGPIVTNYMRDLK